MQHILRLLENLYSVFYTQKYKKEVQEFRGATRGREGSCTKIKILTFTCAIEGITSMTLAPRNSSGSFGIKSWKSKLSLRYKIRTKMS